MPAWASVLLSLLSAPATLAAWRWWEQRSARLDEAAARAARDEAELAKLREREATERKRLGVEEAGVAAKVVLDHAEDLRAREGEHAAERAGHRDCLRRCAALERRVGEEASAREALERVVIWLLERLGIDHDPPPDDVAETLARIRPTTPPPPEPAE